MSVKKLITASSGCALSFCLLSLHGCSFLNIGENEYQCPGGAEGMPCTSARSVYDATGAAMEHFVRSGEKTGSVNADGNAGAGISDNGGAGESFSSGVRNEVLQSGSRTEGDLSGSSVGASAASGRNLISAGDGAGMMPENEQPDPFTLEKRKIIGEAYIVPSLPDRPVPVRTPAGVMRIWVAGWEDDLGDLNAPYHIFVEVEPRRWVVGEPEHHEQRFFAPLEK